MSIWELRLLSECWALRYCSSTGNLKQLGVEVSSKTAAFTAKTKQEELYEKFGCDSPMKGSQIRILPSGRGRVN
ncbi:conserved hypothetical protein [Ricinus communis]|uniref:Uncharacterized protein n=1 Tax=Ricinus communis TaxID=3988 RepID=B9T449_RICCO|nr:conserved hypothetical protein [Ricinus communis]